MRVALTLALLPLLSGCIGAVALPLLAGGTLMARDKHRVRAAAHVPSTPSAPASRKARSKKPGVATPNASRATLTTLKELPPPSGAPDTVVDDRWQQFFAYARERSSPGDGKGTGIESALLNQPPSIDEPTRQRCAAPVAAVVIDLDEGAQAFAPERLAHTPAEVAQGLDRLRGAGLVVLWISRLPASRAGEIAQALRTSGLDPQGQDQLLLVRNGDDRKQALRQDASTDVCIVAIAGGERGDFDELFDYLRNPESAFRLDSLTGHGWFLVPSLEASSASPTER
jgi:hypothetical protein